MDSVSQSCPSCKSSKYNNPRLRLMVNVCGHSLCETCVEVLFVRGSGLCFQCKTPIRKTNFRYQLFENPEVQKEIDIRKKILNDFNKRELDFDTTEEYDLYLEMVEDIIYKLANDIDVDVTKKMVEQYKKDNKDIIKRNRTKQSSSQEFYERQLEKERAAREQREKEEEVELIENRRKRHLRKTRMLQGFFGIEEVAANIEHNSSENNDNVVKPTPPKVAAVGFPLTSSVHSSSASSLLDSKHRFVPPPLSSAFAKPTSMLPSPAPPSARWGGNTSMVPPSARWGGGSSVVPPSASPAVMMTPASSFGMLAPPSGIGGAGLTNWATSKDHHNVHIPTLTRMRPNGQQQDEVVFNRSKTSVAAGGNSDQTVFPNKAAEREAALALLKKMLKPYKPELCGPEPPSASLNKTRWADLEAVYHSAVILRIDPKILIPDNPNLEESVYNANNANGEAIAAVAGDEKRKRGISSDLPKGSCGIAPNVFLSRSLEDSRCGLFI